MIRFEILLPLHYNDGKLVEPEKFVATDDELVQAFGAISTDQVVVRGSGNIKAPSTPIKFSAFAWMSRTTPITGTPCAPSRKRTSFVLINSISGSRLKRLTLFSND